MRCVCSAASDARCAAAAAAAAADELETEATVGVVLALMGEDELAADTTESVEPLVRFRGGGTTAGVDDATTGTDADADGGLTTAGGASDLTASRHLAISAPARSAMGACSNFLSLLHRMPMSVDCAGAQQRAGAGGKKSQCMDFDGTG